MGHRIRFIEVFRQLHGKKVLMKVIIQIIEEQCTILCIFTWKSGLKTTLEGIALLIQEKKRKGVRKNNQTSY